MLNKLYILLVVILLACTDQKPEPCINNPNSWIQQYIEKGKDETGTFSAIYSYLYQGAKVYLVVYEARCCDQFDSLLLDKDGNKICHPSGGISGKGDLQCRDFDVLKTDEILIWKTNIKNK
jgi:hypothetical protein